MFSYGTKLWTEGQCVDFLGLCRHSCVCVCVWSWSWSTRKPLRGDPRAKEFSDDISDDDEPDLAPKMLSEDGGGGFMDQLDAEFDGEKVLEILARGIKSRLRVLPVRVCV